MSYFNLLKRILRSFRFGRYIIKIGKALLKRNDETTILLKISTNITKNEIIKIADFDGKKYWFNFPKYILKDLTDRADPFLCVLIFRMMAVGGDIKVVGASASRTVLDNLKMFCKIWNIWKPDIYKPVNIICNEVPDRKFNNNGKLITCFSGGLDASYTAYKYSKKLATGKNYSHDKSIFVHGADIPLNNPEQYAIAYENAKKMTDDLGIKLLKISTNYREYDHDWECEHGAFFAGVLMFFQKQYSYGCCTNQSIFHFRTIWGLNPFTDNLLSSDVFYFFNDGYEHSRTGRAGMIKDWQIGLNNLRVCWENWDEPSKNCGKCEKCIRTKLNFLVNGVEHMPSMPGDITIEQIKSVNAKKYDHLWGEILDFGIKYGTLSEEYQYEIKSAMERENQPMIPPPPPL